MWNSCFEQQPVENGMYLVLTLYEEKLIPNIQIRQNNQWFSMEEFEGYVAIYWMPIPPLPERATPHERHSIPSLDGKSH